MSKKPKVLFYDIETAPILSYNWGLYEQNAIEVKENWSILSFAWKWQGSKSISCLSLRNFNGNAEAKEKALVEALHSLFNEADITIAHNGDKFDYKKAKARFIYHGLKPTRIVPSIDTLKIARKHFAFSSNKLNDLCMFLRIGQKVKHPGFDMWLGCMANKIASWKLMEKYNKQDVVLLEKLYDRLLPWMHSHPNIALLSGHKGCPKCGSDRVHKRGLKANAQGLQQQFHCQSCNGWYVLGRAK